MNEPHHGAFIKPAHQASRHHHFYANSGAMAGPPSAPTAGGLPYSHLPSARPTGLQVPNRSGGVPMNAGGEHMMMASMAPTMGLGMAMLPTERLPFYEQLYLQQQHGASSRELIPVKHIKALT